MEKHQQPTVWMVISGYRFEGDVASTTHLFHKEEDAIEAQKEMRRKGVGDYTKVIPLPLE